MRHAAVLYEPGRQVTLPLGEGAVRTRVASDATMRDQLEHIARAAATTPVNVTIGVVPFARPFPVAPVAGGFTLLDDTVTIDLEGGDLTIADPAEVEAYTRQLDLLAGVGVTGEGAGELCRGIAAELR